MASSCEIPILSPGARAREVVPLVCPITVNGIPVVVEVYPTTDPGRLPASVRGRADRTRYGRGYFVARHDPGGDAGDPPAGPTTSDN